MNETPLTNFDLTNLGVDGIRSLRARLNQREAELLTSGADKVTRQRAVYLAKIDMDPTQATLLTDLLNSPVFAHPEGRQFGSLLQAAADQGADMRRLYETDWVTSD